MLEAMMKKFRVGNKRIDDEILMKKRREELDKWPTGREVDFEEAVAYQKSLPDSKIWWKVMVKLREEGRMSVFPRAGTPILEKMIELCQGLRDSGVVLIPVTTDSYTRLGQYEKIEGILKECYRTGKPLLNGFPIINYGVRKTRKLIESVDAAFSPRGAGGEIAIAAGMTTFEGCLPFLTWGSYSKKTTIRELVEKWQETSGTVGWYADRGVILCTDLHGWLPSAPFPLSVNIVTLVIEALTAAEQGQKALYPLVHCMGNMAQDTAWIRFTPRIIREYLDRFGYKDCMITGTCPAQTPLFPVAMDMGGAFAYLTYVSMVGALAGANAVDLRSIDEAAGVPTQETHRVSYRAAKWIFDVVREQRIELEMKDVAEEEKVTEIEVRAILDRILNLGDGDIVDGTIKAIESGVLDSPWSPNINVKDRVLGVRDARGACRYLEFGDLPIPNEIKEFHRRKIAEREKLEGRKADYHTAVRDLWSLSKGKIVGIPPFDQ
jgi:methylaspartate mutase epsilon subunit